MKDFLKSLNRSTVSALGNGVVGAGVEYFYYGNTGGQDVFGVNAPAFLVEGLKQFLISWGADIIGEYALPSLESATLHNEMLNKLIKFAVTPVAFGGGIYLVDSFVLPSNIGKDPMQASMMGALQKFAVDRAVEYWL
jgi:hypothetical protein